MRIDSPVLSPPEVQIMFPESELLTDGPPDLRRDQECDEDPITNETHQVAFEWLAPMADFEIDEKSRPSVLKIVESLIKDAQKHGAYATLLKLQAVKHFLELAEKYRRNPTVKNPQERASLAVAQGLSKGPYFAKLL